MTTRLRMMRFNMDASDMKSQEKSGRLGTPVPRRAAASKRAGGTGRTPRNGDRMRDSNKPSRMKEYGKAIRQVKSKFQF